ncbi:MAG: hypothetical protein OHK0024_21490 [Thalassobaculales bacterium]
MTWSCTILGQTFTNANVEGNAYADEAGGLPAILRKLAELGAALLAPGAASASSLAIGTGPIELALLAPATLPRGLYRVESLTEPGNFMLAALAEDAVGTASLTLNSLLAVGSGSHAGWIVAPLTAGRARPVLSAAADLTLGAAGGDALVLATAGGITLTLPAATSAGPGAALSVRHHGASGLVTVAAAGEDTVDGGAAIGLLPGQSVELAAIAGGWATVAGASPRLRQSVFLPAASLLPAETAGAEAAVFHNATSGIQEAVLAFDAAAVETATGSLRLPDSYGGGGIALRLEWSHPAAATNFGVVWGVELRAAVDGHDLAAAGVWGSLATAADTGGAADALYVTPAASLAMAAAAGQRLYLRVTRRVADGADTLAADARLHGLWVDFDCIRFGSDA